MSLNIHKDIDVKHLGFYVQLYDETNPVIFAFNICLNVFNIDVNKQQFIENVIKKYNLKSIELLGKDKPDPVEIHAKYMYCIQKLIKLKLTWQDIFKLMFTFKVLTISSKIINYTIFVIDQTIKHDESK